MQQPVRDRPTTAIRMQQHTDKRLPTSSYRNTSSESFRHRSPRGTRLSVLLKWRIQTRRIFPLNGLYLPNAARCMAWILYMHKAWWPEYRGLPDLSGIVMWVGGGGAYANLGSALWEFRDIIGLSSQLLLAAQLTLCSWGCKDFLLFLGSKMHSSQNGFGFYELSFHKKPILFTTWQKHLLYYLHLLP